MAERELAAFLSVHPPNVRYLTAFTGSAGYLVVRPEGADLVTDPRYGEQAEEEAADGVDVRVAADGWRAEVADRLPDPDGGPVGFESDRVTVRGHERLAEEAPGVDWSGVEGLVDGIRERKEPAEVKRIRSAAQLGDRVLDDFLDDVREGRTEAELATELDYRLRRAGSEGVAFETIVAAGSRSALPHASPSERVVRRGDLLLVDFGARIRGYCSDMTRVFVLGEPEGWQRDLHAAVLGALEAAVDAVGPGVEAAAVDDAARQSLESAGLAEHFGHSTGHGIGLEVHEGPSLSSRSESELGPGHVVTVEPGAYLPGRGGVRLEDDVVVREDGAEVLTGFSRNLRRL